MSPSPVKTIGPNPLKPPKFTIRLSGVKVEVRELFDGSFRIYHPSGELIPYEEFGKAEKGCQKVKLRLRDCPPFCVNSIIAYPRTKSKAGHKWKANPLPGGSISSQAPSPPCINT